MWRSGQDRRKIPTHTWRESEGGNLGTPISRLAPRKTANREIGVPGPQIARVAWRLYNPATKGFLGHPIRLLWCRAA